VHPRPAHTFSGRPAKASNPGRPAADARRTPRLLLTTMDSEVHPQRASLPRQPGGRVVKGRGVLDADRMTMATPEEFFDGSDRGMVLYRAVVQAIQPFAADVDLRVSKSQSASGNSPSERRKAAGHGRDHCDVDHGFVGRGQRLVVADQATVLDEPAEGAFDDPASGDDSEPGGAGIGPFGDRHGKGQNLFRPVHQPSGVSAVGPDQADGAERRAERRQQPACSVPVLEPA
jgi:hypothetical protein